MTRTAHPPASHDFGPWAVRIDDLERRARTRDWRAIASLIVGPGHALTIALGDALDDPTAAERALQQLEALPPLPQRRILASCAALAAPLRPRRARR